MSNKSLYFGTKLLKKYIIAWNGESSLINLDNGMEKVIR